MIPHEGEKTRQPRSRRRRRESLSLIILCSSSYTNQEQLFVPTFIPFSLQVTYIFNSKQKEPFQNSCCARKKIIKFKSKSVVSNLGGNIWKRAGGVVFKYVASYSYSYTWTGFSDVVDVAAAATVYKFNYWIPHNFSWYNILHAMMEWWEDASSRKEDLSN